MSIIGKFIRGASLRSSLFFLLRSASAQSASMDELYKKALAGRRYIKFLWDVGADQRRKNSAGIRKTLPRHQDQSCRRDIGQDGCARHCRGAGRKNVRRRITGQLGRHGSSVRAKVIAELLFLKLRNTPTG